MNNVIRIAATVHQTELHRAALQQRPGDWSGDQRPRRSRQAPQAIRLLLHGRSAGAARRQAPVERVSL